MKISVVVPTVAGRERWLERCLSAYRERSCVELELIVVGGKSTCGEAWIEGAAAATGDYLHFSADDLEPKHGWDSAALAVCDDGWVPIASVWAPDGTQQRAWVPMTGMTYGEHCLLNVLVPFFSREQFELGDWLLPIHYGSDDWISYLAFRRGFEFEADPSYAFIHHAAPEGRKNERTADVTILALAMEGAGYLPPFYENLANVLNPQRLTGCGCSCWFGGACGDCGHPGCKMLWSYRTAAKPSSAKPLPPEPVTWSISPYCGEAEVLEIKLATMAEQVDRFVLAEATVNQRGEPKPLHPPAEDPRFAPWLDKITYVVVDDMPVGAGWDLDWQRERHQRNGLIRGMDDLQPDDVVIVSDLDEIPRPEALAEAIAEPPMRIVMDLHVYRLNWRWLDRDTLIGTLCMTMHGRDLLERGPGEGVSQVMLQRMSAAGPDQPTPVRGHGGWHLTYQGDVARLRAKMTGIADNFWEQLVPEEAKATWNKETFLSDDWIQESIDTGRDIYARDYRRSEWVDLDELPPHVAEHPERFAHMLVPQPNLERT